MSTIHDPRHRRLIQKLREARLERGLTQEALAGRLGHSQSHVAKVETGQRRLDVLQLFDWLETLKYEPQQFFQDLGWFPEGTENVVPVPVDAESSEQGMLLHLLWEGQIKKVLLEGATVDAYRRVEGQVSDLFRSLNADPPMKNRKAICEALEKAVEGMPEANPSDLYQHVVYRLYLREYSRSNSKQSWVRAGGEAVELFIERQYAARLEEEGIRIEALLSGLRKAEALGEMGLAGQVGDSKLDVALYGRHGGEWRIFGGVHSKASLAERVSDDVPCSEAMMARGLSSFLWTFDSKSFPPPHGDLVNRGELGSNEAPSDKRKYIEEHGSFDACFSYNLRTEASRGATRSTKRIYTSSLKPGEDPFAERVISAWKQFEDDL